MKTISKSIGIIILVFLITSCASPVNEFFSPQRIASSLSFLDTLVKTEYMEAPLSQTVRDAMPDSMTVSSSEQMRQTFSKSLQVWKHFRELCDKEEYEAALDYYLEEPKEGEMKNAGAFLFVFESLGRYEFYSSVLYPLLLKYRDKSFALNEYISTLQIEKTMEELTIALRSEDNGYIPEVYPYVLTDLGKTLAKVGRMDEALALVDDLRPAILSIYNGNELDAEVIEAGYKSHLYQLSGNKKMSLSVLNDVKAKLDKENDWYDIVEDAIKKIR